MALALTACNQQVPAGYAGIKVYLLGSNKGVDHEVLGPGRYYIGYNEQLFLFPTFTQTYTFTRSPSEGNSDNEEISFQTKEGLSVSSDIGITYHIDPAHVADVFTKYREGIIEITHTFLRNMLRDQFNEIASTLPVESLYGSGKSDLIKRVTIGMQHQTTPIGIVIEEVYVIGSFRLPDAVTNAINAKLTATQLAQQRENEIQTAKAEAEKVRVTAQGAADAVLINARTQATANQLLTASMTPQLVQYNAIQKWNGEMPNYVAGSGSLPFISINK